MISFPTYKKLFAFGTALIIITVPFLYFHNVDTETFFNLILVLNLDIGIAATLNFLGILLILTSFFLRKVTIR